MNLRDIQTKIENATDTLKNLYSELETQLLTLAASDNDASLAAQDTLNAGDQLKADIENFLLEFENLCDMIEHPLIDGEDNG